MRSAGRSKRAPNGQLCTPRGPWQPVHQLQQRHPTGAAPWARPQPSAPGPALPCPCPARRRPPPLQQQRGRATTRQQAAGTQCAAARMGCHSRRRRSPRSRRSSSSGGKSSRPPDALTDARQGVGQAEVGIFQQAPRHLLGAHAQALQAGKEPPHRKWRRAGCLPRRRARGAQAQAPPAGPAQPQRSAAQPKRACRYSKAGSSEASTSVCSRRG